MLQQTPKSAPNTSVPTISSTSEGRPNDTCKEMVERDMKQRYKEFAVG